MLKKIALTLLTLLIAVGGGAASVWWALDSDFETGTVTVGNWTAFVARGTPSADPYSKARFSREADLALGTAEGLVFIARRDSDGKALRLECDYRLAGPLPPARFWTLHARDENGQVVTASSPRAPALHSLDVLRRPDSSVETVVSRHPSAGNWLATGGEGSFSLVLSLYDTAIAASTRIGELELPQILRGACDG